MNRTVVALSLLLLLSIGTVASAQILTGSIVGTVKDETGAVLPGVTVVVTSPALISKSQDRITDVDGFFRFPALPPGEYMVTMSLDGFATIQHGPLHVSVGGTIEGMHVMKLATVQESVVVTAEAPVVDPTKAGVSTNYGSEYVENTPIARFTFFDLIQSSPGVSTMRFDNAASRSSAFGSNVNENAYQLDGTDLTAPLTGAAWPWPNTDIIEEIQIVGLGAPAEYGNVQGAVFNVVTKSGGNDFSGDLNYYYQTQSLTGNNLSKEQLEALGDPQPFNRAQYSDLTFQIGGPIKRDKIWFFAGFQTRREHFSEPGTPKQFPKEEDDDRYFFKVTTQINEKNKVVAELHNDYFNIPRTISFSLPNEASLTEKGNNPTPSVLWTSILSDKTFLEVRYAGFYGIDKGDLNSGDYSTPGHYDLSTGEYSVNALYWYDGDIWKTQVSGKVSHFANDFLAGDHDFRFGVQFQQGGNDYIAALTGGAKFYDYAGAPYLAYYQTPYHYASSMWTVGTFVDDSWKVNDTVNLSLGVRFDHSVGSVQDVKELDAFGKETGKTITGLGDVITWNTVSPRIGATFKLGAEGRGIVRGYYGRFYQALLTGAIDDLSPGRTLTSIYAWNPDTNAYDDLIEIDDPRERLAGVDPDLKNPYTDQFSLGLDYAITNDFAIGVTGIYKKTRNQVGFINIGATYEPVQYTYFDERDQQNHTITVYDQTNDPEDSRLLLTNPAEFKETYKGLMLTANKRMSKNWMMLASLTISKAEGLNSGSGAGGADSAQDSRATTRFGDDKNDFINAYGLLKGDRKYMFKLTGSYQFPYGIMLSANYNYLSGRPWAPTLRVVDALNQGTQTVMLAPRSDDLRTPAVNLMDIRVQKEFKLGGDFGVEFLMDVFNLLNADAFYDVGSTLATSSSFNIGSVYVPPRRVMFGVNFHF